MKTIPILWSDPIKFNEFIKQENNDDANSPGIYLWASKLKDNVYCVNYVGSATAQSIKGRNFEHSKKFKGYSLIDYESFNSQSIPVEKKEIDMILCNSFNLDEDRIKHNKQVDKLVDLNINNSYIFYFPITDEICNEYSDPKSNLNNFIKNLEGSVKLFFWRKGKTRRYLTSLESMRYNINPDNLEMQLKSDNISVIGINA